MIIAPIEYDRFGNILVPELTDPPPKPSDHLNNTPGVIHRHVFVRHTEQHFEEAHNQAIAMLAFNEGFVLLSENPYFTFDHTGQGLLKNFYMELLYAIDPNPPKRKHGLLARILGH